MERATKPRAPTSMVMIVEFHSVVELMSDERFVYLAVLRICAALMFSSDGTVSSTISTTLALIDQITISGRWSVEKISGGKTSLLWWKSTKNCQSFASESRWRGLCCFFGWTDDVSSMKEWERGGILGTGAIFLELWL